MSSEPEPAQSGTTITWPVLDAQERRVLGVLIEKAKTTPDVYPLSLNSLMTGCNQKSNRDPLMNLADAQVEDALASAQKKGLVIKVTGGRVERWRHALYETWQVNKVELAALGELLLRGPQTEGELRGRASRMEPIDDLEALRAVLRPLAERRLVVYLTAEGRRGTVLTHGFHAPEELAQLRARRGAEEEGRGADGGNQPASTRPSVDSRAEIDSLRSSVTNLEAAVTDLKEQLRQIREALGM
jgi:uncharacterized protein YceH (UPF0502 family)